MRAAFYRARNSRNFSDLLIHELMLSDAVRVDSYAAAIRKHVGPEDVVVDLGTGTGILALLARQRGARRVYAIDHSRILALAEFVARENRLDGIDFVQCHSADFNPPEKVDVILHEQIGGYLIDEDMIRNIADLRDRLLAPGGRILPALFDLFLEPIALKDERRVPFLWEQTLHGLEFGATKAWLETHADVARSPLNNRIFSEDASHLLCEPEPVLTLDLMTARPETFARSVRFRKAIARPGPLDGFCLYFRVRFDDEIQFENGPFDRRTSWYCHVLRTERVDLVPGDAIEAELTFGDHTDVATWKLSHSLVRRRENAPVAAE
jgi:protein arginine N-methyltransferase 1